jgi:hypothetical protein
MSKSVLGGVLGTRLRSVLATLGLAMAALATSVATPALASPPEQPALSVASPVKATEAVFLGVLNPNAAEPTEAGIYTFLYRASNTECEGGSATTTGLALGMVHEELPAELVKGLTPATEYTVCLQVEVGGVKTLSAPVTFTTATPPEAPVTLPAELVTATSATLSAELNPLAKAAQAVEYDFVYRLSPLECREGSLVSELPISATGNPKEEASIELSALQPNATYTFCALAFNSAGEVASGEPVSFKTLTAKSTIDSDTASGVSSTGATLEAQINPNNQKTTFKFEYATEATGETLEGTIVTLGGESSPPAEFGDHLATVPRLEGLAPGTPYYYRVIAKNATGTTTSPVQTFTTVATPNTDPVSEITAATATLNGHFALNAAATQYSFTYRAGGECAGEGATLTTPVEAGTGAGNTEAVTAIAGLQPHTQYAACLITANAFGSDQGSPVNFTTPAIEPTIASESVTEVTATSVRLAAEIAPGGAETTYHFDYGTSAAYGQSSAESPPIGSDNTAHRASAPIQGLEPNTTYHYRVVASNAASPAGGTLGPDQTFTTQPQGGEFTLPDGRGYELVSPQQKDGAEVLGVGGGGATAAGGDATQASEDGRSISYITNAPVVTNPPGNTWSTQLLSSRSSSGWLTQDISPPHANPVGIGNAIEEGEEFLRLSPDLSRAIVMSPHQQLEPSLAPEIHQEVAGATLPGGEEIYVRDNTTNTFRAVLTNEPLSTISFEGASPDIRSVVFSGPPGLDPNHPSSGGLYEWTNGQTQLVSLLPSKLAAGEPRVPANGVGHVVSNDGTHVVWSAEGDLFTRDTATGETVQVDGAQGGGAEGGGTFQAANQDGSRVFFSDSGELTAGAPEGGLYMFDAARPEGERLTDLTPGANGAQVQTFLGANEDGTALYEVSPLELTVVANDHGEKATAGGKNLYVLRETPLGSGFWSIAFVTAGAELVPGGARISTSAPLVTRTVRISPNGRYLAFMSQQRLTGYDNRDANSGVPDQEIYLYDAEAARLVCASCNPTGARPLGQEDPAESAFGIPIDPWQMWLGGWLAATIPGWNPDGSEATTAYQTRYLSDSGRLFFDSTDALVPQDVNGRDDVYQYEPEGIGGCRAPGYGRSASNVLVPAAGGCVGLISAGTGNSDSVFFDASASGDDVFFTTQDGLAAQDKDGTADMYNARVCTASEPCPPSIALPPPCTTTDSCRTAPSPQPGVFGAPASATFSGAGNLPPGSGGAGHHQTAAEARAEKLKKALKTCRKKRNRRKRAACESQARARYGAKTKAKKSVRRSK